MKIKAVDLLDAAEQIKTEYKGRVWGRWGKVKTLQITNKDRDPDLLIAYENGTYSSGQSLDKELEVK